MLQKPKDLRMFDDRRHIGGNGSADPCNIASKKKLYAH